jgi:hypothetical protein
VIDILGGSGSVVARVNDSSRGWEEPRIIGDIVIGCNVSNVNDIAGRINVAKESLDFFRSQPLDRGEERPLVVIRLKLIIYKDAVAFFARATLFTNQTLVKSRLHKTVSSLRLSSD